MKIVMAKTAAELLRAGKSPQEAARACVELLSRRAKGFGGLILLDRQGQAGFAFNTPHMAFGYSAAGGKFSVQP